MERRTITGLLGVSLQITLTSWPHTHPMHNPAIALHAFLSPRTNIKAGPVWHTWPHILDCWADKHALQISYVVLTWWDVIFQSLVAVKGVRLSKMCLNTACIDPSVFQVKSLSSIPAQGISCYCRLIIPSYTWRHSLKATLVHYMKVPRSIGPVIIGISGQSGDKLWENSLQPPAWHHKPLASNCFMLYRRHVAGFCEKLAALKEGVKVSAVVRKRW